MTHAFVVESIVRDRTTRARVGVARVYVASEARANEIVSQGPDRTWRRLAIEEVPEKARENLLRAAN